MDDKKLNITEDVDKVSGGVKEYITLMICLNQCGCHTYWNGNHLGKLYECPDCHTMTYYGEKLI